MPISYEQAKKGYREGEEKKVLRLGDVSLCQRFLLQVMQALQQQLLPSLLGFVKRFDRQAL